MALRRYPRRSRALVVILWRICTPRERIALVVLLVAFLAAFLTI